MKIGSLPVVEEDKLVAIVTESDHLRYLAEDSEGLTDSNKKFAELNDSLAVEKKNGRSGGQRPGLSSAGPANASMQPTPL